MLKQCFIVLYTVLALAPLEAAERSLFVLAGQSNMDGRGLVRELKPDDAKARPQAKIFYFNPPFSSGGWTTLTPGFSAAPSFKGPLPSDTFGPELGFADQWERDHPDTELALIKVAKGGTSLEKDWTPGTGPCYKNFLRALQQANIDQPVRGMLWFQGESDVGLTAEDYAQRLTAFFASVREALGEPELPIVLASVYDDGTPGRAAIRAAQRAVVRNDPRLRLISVDDLVTSDQGTHLDAASQLMTGERFARAFQDLLRGSGKTNRTRGDNAGFQ